MFFRVFWTPHGPTAKTKAELLWHLRPCEGIAGTYDQVPGPDPVLPSHRGRVESIEFTATSYREGREALQELILNGDHRPVMGRNNLRIFRVTD